VSRDFPFQPSRLSKISSPVCFLIYAVSKFRQWNNECRQITFEFPGVSTMTRAELMRHALTQSFALAGCWRGRRGAAPLLSMGRLAALANGLRCFALRE